MSNTPIAVVTVPLTEWNETLSLLKDISQQVKELTNREQKELLTPREVCEVLKISRSTFERYMNDGVFEVVQVSKKKYSKKLIRYSHIEELIRKGVV